ncbi:MAG: hypothetical protein ACE5JU_10165 [Candidatus Binatia bacterium]
MEKVSLWGKIIQVEPEKKRCMVCAKLMVLRGGICDPCHERIKREAMGEQEDLRIQAEKELKKHAVDPDQRKERRKE